jgi:hypothetical protein
MGKIRIVGLELVLDRLEPTSIVVGASRLPRALWPAC